MIPRITLLATVLGLALPLSVSAASLSEVKLEDYRIGYDALLANGAVEDAYHLARDVSHRFPEEREWKRRLAQVAVWTNRPVEGYTAWKELYYAGVRDADVVREVRRLATHYNDAPVLIDLWTAPGASRISSEKDAETLAGLYERDNRPIEGARYFEHLYQVRHHAMYGAQAARLYERAGNDKDAIRLYRTLLANAPANAGWVVAAAKLEIRRDRRSAALDLLKRHKRHMPDSAFEYWQMLGDLAWLYQDDATATDAYRRSTITSSASLADRDRLTYLLLDKDPMEAAAMCLRYYRDGSGSIWLLRALEIQVGQKAWEEARASLVNAQSVDQQLLEKDARFLILRAHISQHFGDNALAAADMHEALGMAPEDSHVLTSALWLFIAVNDRNGISAIIATIAPVSSDPRYWPPLAAAHHALGNYDEALAYTRRELERKPDDPLLLITHAELLAATGQTEMARFQRQRAWQRLQKASVDGDQERYLARVRTELDELPGDAAALRVRRLQAQSREHTVVRQLDEVLLVWALENGQIESVLAWSRARPIGIHTLPTWARLQLALVTHDYEALHSLLDSEAERLPATINAYDAAMLSERWPAAWQLAFEGTQYAPDADLFQQRLVDSIEERGDFSEVAGSHASYYDFDISRVALRADKMVSQNWRLAIEGYYADQSLNTQETFDSLPASDRGLLLEARWNRLQHEWRLAAGQHKELNDYTSWQLAYASGLGKRLNMELLLAANQPTEHTAALQVAGHADRALIGFGTTIDRGLSFNAQLVGERYHTQYDTEVGKGGLLNWEAAYRPYNSYPDWNMRTYGTHYRFNLEEQPDERSLEIFSAGTLANTTPTRLTRLFIPMDNDYLGVCGGVGQNLRTRYSRSLRPLAEACAIHNQETGSGFSFLAGVAGSVSGADRLSLLWERSQEARQAVGRDVTFITLNYRHYY